MGFRKNRNIDMAIFDLLNVIMTNVDNRNPVCALFTDMTKAFDHVNHKILLEKLNAYGIRGNISKLIESYISNRTQIVQLNRISSKSKFEESYLSDTKIIRYGVPQGSVLGPLLFLLYINDLPECIDQKMILFADDSTAVIKCMDKNSYEQKINDTLKAIIDWMESNNLKINLTKTNLMNFNQRTQINNLLVNYHGQTIGEVSTTKFLGILIDSKLTWKPQAELIQKKLNRSAYALSQLAKKLKLESLVVAYHGIVASILRFGIIFWGNCSERENIFRAQKRSQDQILYHICEK
jgi:ribonucleases P/MRP protein subunit RPP40